MPIKIPEDLPARPILEGENIFVMTEGRANRQDIRPLEIAIVNLMPTKIATETQLLRLLGNTPLQVNVTLLRAEGHESKNTAPQHLERFYKTFSQVRDSSFDGMIITGAPVEQLAFEEVDYWDELVGIMDYAKKHVHATLYVGARKRVCTIITASRSTGFRASFPVFSATPSMIPRISCSGDSTMCSMRRIPGTLKSGAKTLPRSPRWRFWPSRMRPGCLWPVRSTGGACSSQGILSTTGIRWMRSIGGMWPRGWRSRLRHITTPVTMRRGPRWSAGGPMPICSIPTG